MMRKYIRDKRSPEPSSQLASVIMSAVKAKNTKPELIIRKLLWQSGHRGYRLHFMMPGKPDIAFLRKKIAIFIHGCFWHRCSICNLPIPKSNQRFWAEKFAKNIERDIRKKEELERLGWKVLILWECEIKSNPETVLKMVMNFIAGLARSS